MMKKLLAVVLALTLALGMTTVAFAASKTEKILVGSKNELFTYDSDKKVMTVAKGEDFAPGKTFYIPVWNEHSDYNNGNKNITSTSALSGYKLRRSIEDGSKVISNVQFVVKNVDKFEGTEDYKDYKFSNNKQAFICITTKDLYSSDDIDVDMDINVYGSSTYKVEGGDSVSGNDLTVTFDHTLSYESKDATNYISVTDAKPIINFDDIDSDEIEIGFNEAKDDVRFVVNAKGQKELFLRYSNDDGSSIAAPIVDKYPEAALDFHLFEGNNKTFRRTGKLYIPASEIEVKDGKMGAPYLYEIVNGKLTEIKATYDSNAEEFVISTNKLGNYVVSDTKLKSTTEKDESSSKDETSSTTETTTTKPGTSTGNPDTGANDVVGVAVALAVVSLAAIGATFSFKKRTK